MLSNYPFLLAVKIIISCVLYIKVLLKLSLFRWLWAEAGKQPELESTLEIGGFGYPALAVLNVKKMKYSILRGSFSEDGIKEFLRYAIVTFSKNLLYFVLIKAPLITLLLGICRMAGVPLPQSKVLHYQKSKQLNLGTVKMENCQLLMTLICLILI